MNKIRKKLKDMITMEVVNHLEKVDLEKSFPNVGKWISKYEGNNKYNHTFNKGINPNIRMDWNGSYFYDNVKTTNTNGVERITKRFFVGFSEVNGLVSFEEIGQGGWLRGRRFDEQHVPNIEIGKLRFMDIVLHNKLNLCLKCNWTLDNNIKELGGDGLYIRNGRYIDGGYEMSIDWTSLMREEKLKELGI